MNRINCPDDCSACCHYADLVPELQSFDIGDGTCKHLKDNKCSIYDSRPEICRTELMHKKTNPEMSWEEYLKESEKACEILRKELERRKK